MEKIGIICEYNPFHNGHIYHIEKIKEKFPNSTIIAVVSGNFTQRGIPSILTKEEKTKIALKNGIDLVVELPFAFASQSADIFAYGAVKILDELKVDYLVFGSESNDIEKIKEYAKTQLNNSDYEKLVKDYLSQGLNYPTALSKAIGCDSIKDPNDLLGISYLKALIKLNSNIVPVTIKRTNDYHSKTISNISSATAIRNALNNGDKISDSVPKDVYKIIKNRHEIDYFKYLKYKIISEGTSINKYQTVDEGIENRIIKVIDKCSSTSELIESIKTKRYTYNKLSRMLIHVLCSFTKEEANKNNKINYIMVLGFTELGQKYLNEIKKKISIPIITTTKYYSDLLTLQKRVDSIYNLIK